MVSARCQQTFAQFRCKCSEFNDTFVLNLSHTILVWVFVFFVCELAVSSLPTSQLIIKNKAQDSIIPTIRTHDIPMPIPPSIKA